MRAVFRWVAPCLAVVPLSESLLVAPSAGSPNLRPDSLSRTAVSDGPGWDPLLLWENRSRQQGARDQLATDPVEGSGDKAASEFTRRRDLLCQLAAGISKAPPHILAATHGRLERTWKSCAVVSSSGVLQRHNHGADIDKADLVIRFNGAPVRGYEAMVGRRDDMRIVNNQFAGLALSRAVVPGMGPDERFAVHENTSYVVVPLDADMNELPHLHRVYPAIEMMELAPDVHASLSKVLQNIYPKKWFQRGRYPGVTLKPTTGAVGLVFSLAHCNEVRAYGMAATPAAVGVPHYYYGTSAPGSRVGLPRDASDQIFHKTFDAEKDLWRRLATNSTELDEFDVAVIQGFPQLRCS